MTSIYRFLPQKVYLLIEQYVSDNYQDEGITLITTNVYGTAQKAAEFVLAKAEQRKIEHSRVEQPEDVNENELDHITIVTRALDAITLESILKDYENKKETFIPVDIDVKDGGDNTYRITEERIL